MHARSDLSAELTKYFAIFSEGMIEIIVAAVISALVTSFVKNTANLPGAKPELLLGSIACVFIISVIVNILKGVFQSFEAFVSILGMMTGLWLFGSTIWSIAPNATIDISIYIIAAIVGIVIGMIIRNDRGSQEQRYYF